MDPDGNLTICGFQGEMQDNSRFEFKIKMNRQVVTLTPVHFSGLRSVDPIPSEIGSAYRSSLQRSLAAAVPLSCLQPFLCLGNGSTNLGRHFRQRMVDLLHSRLVNDFVQGNVLPADDFRRDGIARL